MNSFKGGIFGHKDKIDELLNYFANRDDEATINKAHNKDPDLVFLVGFQRVMDVSDLQFLR